MKPITAVTTTLVQKGGFWTDGENDFHIVPATPEGYAASGEGHTAEWCAGWNAHLVATAQALPVAGWRQYSGKWQCYVFAETRDELRLTDPAEPLYVIPENRRQQLRDEATIHSKVAPNPVDAAAAAVAALSDDARVKLFSDYCRGCGTPGPCHCENDE